MQTGHRIDMASELHRVAWMLLTCSVIAFLILASSDIAGAQAGNRFVGTYTRSYFGASGTVTSQLDIRNDGTAVMITRYQGTSQPVIQTGTWNVRGDRLSVTLNRPGGGVFSRDRFTFVKRGSSLIATQYDRRDYGRSGLVFTETRQPEVNYVGTYTRTFPGASGTANMTLDIRRNGAAVLTTRYQNVPRPIVSRGTWTVRRGQLYVTLTRRGDQPINETFTFRKSGNQLIATRYDRSTYGDSGLIFIQPR